MGAGASVALVRVGGTTHSVDDVMGSMGFRKLGGFSSTLAVASLLLLPACGEDEPDPEGLGAEDTADSGDSAGDSAGNDSAGNDSAGNDSAGNGGDGMGEPDPDAVDLPDPADYDYAAEHVFSMADVVGDFDGLTAAEDPSILCMDCPTKTEGSATLYPIDSAFGFTAIDFVGAEPRLRDGEYSEGWIGELFDPDDNELEGVAISTDPTVAFRTGALAGGWCAGVGGAFVKCSTEHFSTMEHVLTCDETLPYMFYDPVSGDPNDPVWEVCEPLDVAYDVDPTTLSPYEFDLEQMAFTTDFSVTQKDDGKVLYRWGTYDKRPTDVRLNVRIPLPEEWKGDQVYRITKADLAVVHTVSNSPNDQIRPEDFENEAATGRKPAYEVLDDGRWVSTVDCYEGDGDFIPAGTTLRNPAFADPDGLSSDLRGGYTNAWYTSTDREPFEADPVTGSGPRWRLRSAKFGQDLPGVEIPLENCAAQPLRKGEAKYETGEAIATIVNLLDWVDGEESPLALSAGWMEPTLQAMSEEHDGVTINGLALSDDFDLSLYIKGEYKAARVYRAVLYLNYEPQ